MKSIINLFWGICLLRQSPAAVPGQRSFVVVVVAADLLASVLVSQSLPGDADLLRNLTGIVVGQAVTASLVWLVLAARDLGARYATTIAALFGCDLLLTLCFGLAVPLLYLLGAQATALASLVLMLWSVIVVGFILHRAAEVTLSIGIGLALGMSLFGVAVGQIAVGA